MAQESKTIYLPRMRTRPGFTHSYQSAHGTKVETVDPEKRKAPTTSSKKVVTTGDGE